MKFTKNLFLSMKLYILQLFTILLFATSCSKNDDNVILPLNSGINITMRNTLQDAGQPEVTYPSLFGKPDNAYDEQAVLSNTNVEFNSALAQQNTPVGNISGLFKIDFTENSITYTVLPQLNDPFWGTGGIADVFGVTPEGKFDRYYFTFSQSHNIKGFTSTNNSINLRIDSDKVVVVEVRSGFNLQPGATFTINLK